MRKIILNILFCVLWCEEVRSQIENNEVKRGAYPYMAVLYYPDDSVRDSVGFARFQRAGVLIRPEWLISAAIDHRVKNGKVVGFPTKTLIARMGALTLDGNYTFNEDEDEQEREIIQIVKPRNHKPFQWWLTDITLLLTLSPFKLTSTVALAKMNTKKFYEEKMCVMVAYAKKVQQSEDRTLMQLNVEILPGDQTNCGPQFSDATMACAVPNDESKSQNYEMECQGNSGGPLVCEGYVIALQTYLEPVVCKPPYLYQLLAPWDAMITCGTEHRCGADASCGMCVAINKDTPVEDPTTVEPTTGETTTIEPTTNEPTTTEATTNEATTNEATTVEPTAITTIQSDTTVIQNDTDATDQQSTLSDTGATEETDAVSKMSSSGENDPTTDITVSKDSTVTSDDTAIPTNISESSITTVPSKDSAHVEEESGRRILTKFNIFKDYAAEKLTDDRRSENVATPLDALETAPPTPTSLVSTASHTTTEEINVPRFRADGSTHFTKALRAEVPDTTPIPETTSQTTKTTTVTYYYDVAPLKAGCSSLANVYALLLLILACLIELMILC